MKRKVCVYTSTRAEYGLLKGIMKEIQQTEILHLQIFVSGMHLSPEFGMTIQEIIDDGFEPDETIEMLLSSDTPISICKSMGLAMIGYGETLQRLKPDLLVLLGDRYETFCIAAAAQICRIPVAHIHGGETTEGAIDESFRHAISKMSHLHFASCEAYRMRIIQLGESPNRVFNVGALGIENMRHTTLMDWSTLVESIGINSEKPFFIVTFHPVTLEKKSSHKQFTSLLDALDDFPDFNIIFTKSNADTDGRIINHLIDNYVTNHPNRCLAFTSLGLKRYLSAMKFCKAVIGNSSSGIIEAPSFKTPTINIGDRQKGRIQANSILNCEPESLAIKQAINLALSSTFQKNISSTRNPYNKPETSATIVRAIKEINIKTILKKKFYDIEISTEMKK